MGAPSGRVGSRPPGGDTYTPEASSACRKYVGSTWGVDAKSRQSHVRRPAPLVVTHSLRRPTGQRFRPPPDGTLHALNQSVGCVVLSAPSDTGDDCPHRRGSVSQHTRGNGLGHATRNTAEPHTPPQSPKPTAGRMIRADYPQFMHSVWG